MRWISLLVALVLGWGPSFSLSPSAAASPLATITVHVTGTNPFNDTPGPPIAGIEVELLIDARPVATSRTDQRGEAVFGGLAAGSYQVRFPGEDTLVGRDITLPAHDPDTGELVYSVIVYPKRTVPPGDEPAPPVVPPPAPGSSVGSAPGSSAGTAAAPTASPAPPPGDSRGGILGTLALTGAGTLPLLIAGAVCFLVGLLLIRRRNEEERTTS
ncbi:carboxypeptidase-like regulatory domain-containing protein [Corynebacterium sp.]|uniref:carboxypeptidase-like regulatory domain-containing protein n=1 Tax=Corynebacterium sp. TaxID=1720 RepID=UPI0026DFB351|nr:carboxypeptidase-like regulatory domain-containing protein [Corynebacterium sp.]MDO5512740.1 carboxypeptidase-like regulatory domain-containing protein [Corynebacterium sp.]